MIRVLVVDDHKFFRQGVRALLMNSNDVQIVGEARDGLESIEAAQALKPDVVLMDLEMPRLDGFQATRALLATPEPPKVLVLSMRTSERDFRDAAESGAHGFLIKNCSREDLVRAIRAVYAGGVACSPEAVRYFHMERSPRESLGTE